MQSTDTFKPSAYILYKGILRHPFNREGHEGAPLPLQTYISEYETLHKSNYN